MKATIKVEKEFDLKTLEVFAKVRYWEDSSVNEEDDTENGDLIPCKVDDNWCPIIDIDTGIITNWEKGKTAEIHYKVCDCCAWGIKDIEGNLVLKSEGDYVPGTLSPKEPGYGDYIIMDISEDGTIQDWHFYIEDFIKEDEY
ncbi:hypothetical protein MG290_01765 [Flavobacterium sp. CBA20B-1]|uniref:hypothetical protein n=1 Tax=unclassified Flavobacterium TaxID=196869 RepID=UPI002224D2B9|nr:MULTISPECIES: hypothetical protein [unclassified Flavobacterium]WCM42422.1 hypothetical protein MG290_01765 [Flavobacterium sp. CBA20B-1]